MEETRLRQRGSMKLKEIKDFINAISEEYDESEVSFREVSVQGDRLFALDKPIEIMELDCEGKELLLFTKDTDTIQKNFFEKFAKEL